MGRVAMPLAMVGLLPNVEISYGLALVPIANVVLLVKAMLLGSAAIGPGLVATLATAVYAGIENRFAVDVEDGRGSVDGATVCLWKGTEIYEGTSEIMRFVIAREIMRAAEG